MKYVFGTLVGGSLVFAGFLFLLGWAERKGIIVVTRPRWREEEM